jgi:hypothetical protein
MTHDGTAAAEQWTPRPSIVWNAGETSSNGSQDLKDKSMDLETIAAYIEGRLPAGRNAEVAAYLARSPDAFQVFADAVALRAELTRLSPASENATAPARRGERRPRRWLYAGAASAAAVAALFLVTRSLESGAGPPLFLTAEELRVAGAGSLDRALGEDWAVPPWSSVRGSVDAQASRANAFRAGALASHLLLAADADDGQAVRATAGDLTALRSTAAGPALARITEIASTADPTAQALAPAVNSLRDVHEEHWFDLGAWVEQARLAVIAEDTGFFDSDAVRAIRSLRRELAGDAAAATVIDRIDALLGRIEADAAVSDIASLRPFIDAIFEAAA